MPPLDANAGISAAVYNTLGSTNARLERFAWLGDDLAVGIWNRQAGESGELTSYFQPGHHTLSCYLDGGYRTERLKLADRMFGSPRRLCTMPDDHESHWLVRDRMRFLHLYFSPEHFTRRAVAELDREPRELTLADRTYFEQPRIVQLCGALMAMDWHDADDALRANETAHAILSELLQSQSATRRELRIKGGLSPAARRLLADYIDTHLDEQITLGTLAQLACLSEYHLARMFRLSFGMPPHAWISMRRLDRAKTLLTSADLPLQQVADACGYADLSHFSHRFRAAAGVSPSRFRQLLGVSAGRVLT